jgi:hypothetical protein
LQQPEAEPAPTTTGSVLGEALRVFGRRPWRYLALAALLFVPWVVLYEVLSWPWYEIADWVGFLLIPVAEGAIAYAVLNESTLRGPGLAAYVRIASRFARLIVAGLVWGLLVVIGLVLLIVPGCLLIARWSVYVPAVVAERDSGLGLGRSRDLTVGRRWVGFWVTVVPFAPWIALWVPQLLWGGVDEGAWRVAANAAGLVLMAYAAVALAVLYRRLVEQA